MKITKLIMSLRDKVLLENTVADTEKNKANIDYIAMMSDIEIPTEEEENAQSEI